MEADANALQDNPIGEENVPGASSETSLPTAGFEALPSDILFNILSRLTPETAASKVALLSKSFHALSGSPSLWQHFCSNGVLTEEDAQSQGDWKYLFRKVFRTNLLCSPHFELLDDSQKEQEIDDLEQFEPERLSPWYQTNNSEFDFAEGNVGANPLWLSPSRKWLPWEFIGTSWGELRHLVARELRPVGCDPCPAAPWAPCLVTGYQLARIQQRVGLRHFPRDFLDSCPPILVSAWYAGRYDCPSSFDITVELRDGRDGSDIIYQWSASGSPDFDRGPLLDCLQNGWAKAQRLITDYPKGMEEVQVTLMGQDERCWSGW